MLQAAPPTTGENGTRGRDTAGGAFEDLYDFCPKVSGGLLDHLHDYPVSRSSKGNEDYLAVGSAQSITAVG
jgi:hypothetical protein